MKSFSTLYTALEAAVTEDRKSDLVYQYLSNVSAEDSFTMLALFTGRKPSAVFSRADLKESVLEFSGMKEWMFEECIKVVGDFSETIALMLPAPESVKETSLAKVVADWLFLKSASIEEKKRMLFEWWNAMDGNERFMLNRLLSGGFRPPVSMDSLCRALAHWTGIENWRIHFRLARRWSLTSDTLHLLLYTETPDEELARPFPSEPYRMIGTALDIVGRSTDWRVDAYRSGVRVQIIRRGGFLYICNVGGEWLTERFPEIKDAFEKEPFDFVLEGEIVAFRNGEFLPFHFLERRFKGKNRIKNLQIEVPVVFIAYDILEMKSVDFTRQTLAERSTILKEFSTHFSHPCILFSEPFRLGSWDEVEHFIKSALPGRTNAVLLRKWTGDFHQQGNGGFVWKDHPVLYTMNAVMIYSQSIQINGGGTEPEFTFAVWKEQQLIPVGKAGISALSRDEQRVISEFVKLNTIEKYGPVRNVKPHLVFEVGFSGGMTSKRHKSGLVLRGLQVLRWLQTEEATAAHTLDDLLSMIRP